MTAPHQEKNAYEAHNRAVVCVIAGLPLMKPKPLAQPLFTKKTTWHQMRAAPSQPARSKILLACSAMATTMPCHSKKRKRRKRRRKINQQERPQHRTQRNKGDTMSAKREKAHVKAQQAGRKRDHNTCQICGSRIDPEGHHIIDKKYNGAPIPDNIITLCHQHHRAVHEGLVDIVKF